MNYMERDTYGMYEFPTNGRTLAQLHNEARQRGVKGRSRMNKAQLEEALKR